MYLDVKVRLSNKFWARHLVDTVAMWLKCNSTPPFRVDIGQPEVDPGCFSDYSESASATSHWT
jgi:hypothetical protein